ncbi:MAG TPA: thioredoxin domain-containing protein, partial [Polyangia bacterium]|nr:thioredoxin domain-containing protein [Polyangia bacterium]
MNKGTVLLLLVVVLGGGYGLGRLATRDKDSTTTGAANAAAMNQPVGPSDGVDRIRVPLEGPSKGPANAKVNIVEFSDFQCPFCSRVVPTIQKIEKDYPNQVRIFFRHNPLPFHEHAPLAAEAAVAAEAQGKFWEMHDKMFANQQALDRAGLE